MSFWRAAGQDRLVRKHWGLSDLFMGIELSPLAARLIYDRICIMGGPLPVPANEPDGKWW